MARLYNLIEYLIKKLLKVSLDWPGAGRGGQHDVVVTVGVWELSYCDHAS